MAPTSLQEATKTNCLMSPANFPVDTNSSISQSHSLMSFANSPEEAKPDGVMSHISSQEDTKLDSLISHTRTEEKIKSDCVIPFAKCSEETQPDFLVSCKKCPVEKQSHSLLGHKCPEEMQSASQEDMHCSSCTGQGKTQAGREIVKSNELLLLQLEEVKALKRIPMRMIPPGAASRVPLVYNMLVLRRTHYSKGKCFAMSASFVEGSDGSLTIMRTS